MQPQYRFRFSEEHLLTSFLRYRQQLWWRKWFLGLKWVLAIPFAAVLGLAVYSGAKLLATVLGGLFGMVLGGLTLGWRIDALLLRRRFRRSPYYNDDITYFLSEEGSRVLGRDSEVRIGWSSFTRARRYPDGLLLFQGPGMFNWLPDAAALEPATVKEVDRLLRTYVADYRDA